MIDAGVIGANRLALVGKQLKVAGAGGLRRELLAGLRTAAKPLVEDVRQAARTQLPKHGGLNERVAGQRIAVANRLTGAGVGVRITTKDLDTRDTDGGRVKHPVFGRRKGPWVWQQTPQSRGWFTETLDRESPKVTAHLFAAMEKTAVQLTKL